MIWHYILQGATLLVFVWAAIQDAKTKIVPIYASIPIYIGCICNWLFNPIGNQAAYIFINLITAVLVAGAFLLMARYMGGGGGDVILLPLIPLVYGALVSCISLALACTIFIVYALATKSTKKKEHPFIPSITISLAITLTIQMFIV